VLFRSLDGTEGRQLFLALTALGLFGSWGVAGGPAVPLAQDPGRDRKERARFALNVTFWW